jgi:hypothetical protein
VEKDGIKDPTKGAIVIRINAARGHYAGQNAVRVYLVDVHRNLSPRSVTINGRKMEGFQSKDGIIQIKTPYLSTSKDQVIRIYP